MGPLAVARLMNGLKAVSRLLGAMLGLGVFVIPAAQADCNIFACVTATAGENEGWGSHSAIIGPQFDPLKAAIVGSGELHVGGDPGPGVDACTFQFRGS